MGSTAGFGQPNRRRAIMATQLPTVTLHQDKVTSRTVRFAEQVGDDESPVIGTLYVPKASLGDDPESVPAISVQVTVLDIAGTPVDEDANV